MPMKRSRVDTEEELTLSVAIKQQQQQQKQSTAIQARVQEIAKESNPPKLGHFLDNCHYCKKHMPVGVEVYMYRDFCGFCSIGCREIQMSLDKLAKKQAKLAQKQSASISDKVDQ
ncbi:FCS-Like Zinc finger 6-like [Coffea eugenioides]|uniref:FCS-Like Zinc finger 6-like n=1 Tax=Coffea eugenioides TaxID=49369 RepID=UPI000F6070D3|nr:FCS-Like Zinc finger 6-like [Coffea eugenioides]